MLKVTITGATGMPLPTVIEVPDTSAPPKEPQASTRPALRLIEGGRKQAD